MKQTFSYKGPKLCWWLTEKHLLGMQSHATLYCFWPTVLGSSLPRMREYQEYVTAFDIYMMVLNTM